MRLFLLIALLVSTALAQTDQELVARFERAEAAGYYDRALGHALALAERHPESAVWAFNAGRMHARVDEADRAIGQLRRAAELGYTGISSFEQHADLAALRERDDFRAIVEQVRANAAERLEEFKREALGHQPPTHVPASAGPNPPLVIALHGTGGRGQPMLDALRPVCDELGVVCVAPDALRPAGPGFSWTYRDEAEWFVEHLIRKAVQDHGVDPGRVILLGFSQGANITLVMGRTHPGLFLATVPICGHYEPSNAPVTARPAPTYLLTGSRDPARPTYTAARKDLEAAETPTSLRVVSGLGHQVPNARELERALRWCLDQSPTPHEPAP